MESREIIIDSSVWVSFFNELDSQHDQALLLRNEISKSKILPDFILQETGTVLKNKLGVEVAKNFIDLFIGNNAVSLVSFFEFQDSFSQEFSKNENEKLSYIDSSLLWLARNRNYKIITLDKDLLKQLGK
jgi:predicted nucleic acid-binding protein